MRHSFQSIFIWSSKTRIIPQITHASGWNLTDLQGVQDVAVPSASPDAPQLLIFNSEEQERRGEHVYYWKAPAPFLGARLLSYGANLHYYVYYVPSEPAQGHPTPIADVVLQVLLGWCVYKRSRFWKHPDPDLDPDSEPHPGPGFSVQKSRKNPGFQKMPGSGSRKNPGLNLGPARSLVCTNK